MKALSCILVLLTTILFFHCYKEDLRERPFPRLFTSTDILVDDSSATIEAEIINHSPHQIKEYGVIYGTDTLLHINSGSRVEVHKDLFENLFTIKITSGIRKDQLYFVRAYIKADNITILGNTVSFIGKGSVGHIINTVVPRSGYCNDTISIYGEHFSWIKEENILKFNNISIPAIYSSDTLIRCVVPILDRKNVQISLDIFSRSSVYEDFEYQDISISPENIFEGYFNDTFRLKGKGFNEHTNFWAQASGVVAQSIVATPEELKIFFTGSPYYQHDPPELKIISNCKTYISNQPFYFKPPIVTGYSPTTIKNKNEELEIVGKGFSSESLQITADGYLCTITAISQKGVKVLLPSNLFTKISLKKDLEIVINNAGTLLVPTIKPKIDWENVWTELKKFPGLPRHSAVAFTTGKFGYYGLGESENNILLRDFWKYDSEKDEWTRLVDFPGEARSGSIGFAINETGYIGLGYSDHYLSDFYSYSTNSGLWQKQDDFPGGGRKYASAIAHHTFGLVGGGYDGRFSGTSVSNAFYKFDAATRTWSGNYILPEFAQRIRKAFYNFKDTLHFHAGANVYKFVDNNWIPYTRDFLYNEYVNSFVFGNTLYFGFGLSGGTVAQDSFFGLNLLTDQMESFPLYNKFSACQFLFDNKAIIIGGAQYQWATYSNEVFEFDPSRNK